MVVFGLVWYAIYGTRHVKKVEPLKAKSDTKQEITIKQHISGLRGSLSKYFTANKTYKGWQPDAATVTNIQTMGSKIVTQNMTATTYMIYAEMPSSKLIFCLDNATPPFTGEVAKISGSQKTCKK